MKNMKNPKSNIPVEILEVFNYEEKLISRTEIKRPDLVYKYSEKLLKSKMRKK